VDLVDVATLAELLDRFTDVTRLGAIIADACGEAITPSSRFTRLCKRIRTTPQGRQRCFESDRAIGRAAAEAGKPCMHYCHAGLLDVAAPIVVNGEFVGSVLCGQVLFEPPDEAKVEDVYARVADLGIAREEVAANLANITIIDEDRFRAAGDLLHVLANAIVNLLVSLETQQRLSEESRVRVELEKGLKEMELRVLQSQVNPHFLFNTLNTLSRMAMFEDAPKTQDLADRLTRLLRFTLSRIDQLIPLREELVRVEDYLRIQQVRFGERVRYRVEVPDEVLEARIPILTVQPLVENAVVRGLEPLPQGGEVFICGERDGEDAVIDVIDDGTGLDLDAANSYLSYSLPPSGGGHTTGLGIPNVHQRLQHYFGTRYGLSFLPVMKGTQVRIRVPLRSQGSGMDAAAQDAHRRG
jgi:two-component system LytT family sensor kinase